MSDRWGSAQSAGTATRYFVPVGDAVQLMAGDAEEARTEAHDEYRWHVLGKAPPGTVPEGAPDSRVGWCVRGQRRAVIYSKWSRYFVQEFRLEGKSR